jgi:hypothetical protein
VVAEDVAGSVIDLVLDGRQVLWGVDAEVGAFREVLA